MDGKNPKPLKRPGAKSEVKSAVILKRDFHLLEVMFRKSKKKDIKKHWQGKRK